MCFPRHNSAVMSIKWSGHGHIYSGSRDRHIRVLDPEMVGHASTFHSTVDPIGARSDPFSRNLFFKGEVIKIIEGHGHWVNFLALNTDHALRSGPYSHNVKSFASREEAFAMAKKKYKDFLKTVGCKELLVSCSDDQTLFLWNPLESKKSISRMVGHQGPITHVCFSNNGQFIASASFDKSVRLWNGRTGEWVSS